MRVLNLMMLLLLLIFGIGVSGCSGNGQSGGDGEGSSQAGQANPVLTELMPGLSYVDSVLGQGPEVQADDFIVAHYAGYVYENGAKANK